MIHIFVDIISGADEWLDPAHNANLLLFAIQWGNLFYEQQLGCWLATVATTPVDHTPDYYDRIMSNSLITAYWQDEEDDYVRIDMVAIDDDGLVRYQNSCAFTNKVGQQLQRSGRWLWRIK